jgi:apolipoprotein D and lipocalin family protein
MLAALVTAAEVVAVTPVTDFALSRYFGTWYEIASIPGSFRNRCASDTRTEYAPEEGGALILRTRCTQADGKSEDNEGRARPLDPDVPAVLKVTYVNQLGIWWYPFGRNQVVIATGRDYEWLVIADPSRTYGRIISRRPVMSDEALRAAMAALAEEKYDLCAFTLKPQAGGRARGSRLCDEAQ